MKYVNSFDSIRGLSIILVVLTHLDSYEYLPEVDFFRKNIWLYVSGNTGVTLFFILSGFLITKKLQLEYQENLKINFKRFFIKRFLRLTPPLVVFYIITVIAIQNHVTPYVKETIIYSILYLYNYIPREFYVGEYGHLWSLSVEEQFYVMWPFLIAYINHKLSFILITLIIICVLIITLSVYYVSTSKEYFTERFFIPAGLPIFLGSFFALNSERISKINLKYIAVILFFIPLSFNDSFLKYGVIFLNIAFAIWINQLYNFDYKLRVKPLEYIGRISYGLYVYQGFFLKTGPSSDYYLQKYPLNIIISITLSIISYEIIERKILKYKSNI